MYEYLTIKVDSFLATSEFFVFTKYDVYKKLLFETSWTKLYTTTQRMDGSFLLWYDDLQIKPWIIGGRQPDPNRMSMN